jgi:hypothetical protein
MPAAVDAVRLIGVLGRLGYIAQMIEAEVKRLRAAMKANRGPDCDESLRRLIETYGASPQRLAETALEFLEPKPKCIETNEETEHVRLHSLRTRSRSLAAKLRQRLSRKNKAPSNKAVRR